MGEDISIPESGGEVTGEGKEGSDSKPNGGRGFGIFKGEDGAGTLAGEGWRCGDGRLGNLRLLRFRSPELADLAKARSALGDCVRLPPTSTDWDILLSLSPASLPRYIEERLLTESDLPRKDMLFVCDRGVGHSIGLLDLEDTAADDDCLLSY